MDEKDEQDEQDGIKTDQIDTQASLGPETCQSSGIISQPVIIATNDKRGLDDLSHHHPPSPPRLFELKKTPTKGYGLFALARIPRGSCVLSEKPLICISQEEEESQPDAVEEAFAQLTKSEKSQFLHLHDARRSGMTKITSIYYSNCYVRNMTGGGGGVGVRRGGGGSCLGLLSSRINHSCIPNVQYAFNETTGLITFYAIKSISTGREIVSNYCSSSIYDTAAQRQQTLRSYYDFVCTCEACLPKTNFWQKSDDRRRQMAIARKEVVRLFGAVPEKVAAVAPAPAARTAIGHSQDPAEVEALRKLEHLLVREGLVGHPLARVCGKMAKWAEKRGELAEAKTMKAREMEVDTVCFGADSPRVAEHRRAVAKLDEMMARAEGTADGQVGKGKGTSGSEGNLAICNGVP